MEAKTAMLLFATETPNHSRPVLTLIVQHLNWDPSDGVSYYLKLVTAGLMALLC